MRPLVVADLQVQSLMTVEPVVLVVRPTGQLRQEVWYGAGWYVASSHAMHTLAVSLRYSPGSHAAGRHKETHTGMI